MARAIKEADQKGSVSFFDGTRASLRQQLASERTPFASLTPAPPTVSFVPPKAELVSGGPHPLPVEGTEKG